jgi:hypothetical protein
MAFGNIVINFLLILDASLRPKLHFNDETKVWALGSSEFLFSPYGII